MNTSTKKKQGKELFFIKYEAALKSLPSKIRRAAVDLFETSFNNEKKVIEENYAIGKTVAASLGAKTNPTDIQIKELSLVLNKKVQTLYKAYAVTEVYTIDYIHDLMNKAKLHRVIFEWKFLIYLASLKEESDEGIRRELEEQLVAGKLRGATLNNKINGILASRNEKIHTRNKPIDSFLTADISSNLLRLFRLFDSFRRQACNKRIEAVLYNAVNDINNGVLSSDDQKILKQIRNSMKIVLDKLNYLIKLIPDGSWNVESLNANESLDVYSNKLRDIVLKYSTGESDE